MGLYQSTPPAAEPMSIQEAKLHLRQDESADDTLIQGLIATARHYAETATGRQLVCAKWKHALDDFSGYDDWIKLYKMPLIGVDSITYVASSDGTTQTLSSALYQVEATGQHTYIAPAYGEIWPVPRGQPGSVTVTYTAGYATPFTCDKTTNILTLQGRTPTDGAIVRVQNSGGEMPAALSPATDYYVVQASGSTCKLALTSGGAAIDLLEIGSGLHFLGEIPPGIKAAMLLMIGHLYENRGSGEMPKAVDWMLTPFDVGEYV